MSGRAACFIAAACILLCSNALGANVGLAINLDAPEPVSPLTYGIFFEEVTLTPGVPCISVYMLFNQQNCHRYRLADLVQIGHAGDGGLHAELVQDRSFDALAAATGFASGQAPRLSI